MRYEQDYKSLLFLAIEVCESVKGRTAPVELSWLTDTQPFSGKLVQHLATVLYLSNGTTINDVGSHRLAFTDHSSVNVLIRACFETYLAFHHIFIAAPTLEEKKFRHSVWELGGYLTRQRGPLVTEEGKRKVAGELSTIARLRKSIEETSAYKARTKEIQKVAKAGKWKLGKQWGDLAVEAHFHRKYFDGVYCYLCDYAHSGGLSLLQINASDTAELQREHVENMLGVCLVIMAHFIFAYSSLYEEATHTLEKHHELTNLASVYHLKVDEMREYYG